jgi:DNA-binding NarL/FixJ family response regulator
MDRTRVLIADDNAGYGSMLSRFVSSHHNLEVVGLATDGRQAVQMASVFEPDLVVMDLYMPEIDGFEATRRLKASARPPRVVVMTAHKSDENRALAQAAGADAFVVKQEVDRGLVEIICDLMEREGRFRTGAGEGPAAGA